MIGAYSDVAAAISDLGPALVLLKRTLRELGAPDDTLILYSQSGRGIDIREQLGTEN